MLLFEREWLGGTQEVYKYENGFGASVIRGPYTYGGEEGLWEVAVLNNFQGQKYHLCFSTKITDDVLGYLTREQVEEVLKRIEMLPKED